MTLSLINNIENIYKYLNSKNKKNIFYLCNEIWIVEKKFENTQGINFIKSNETIKNDIKNLKNLYEKEKINYFKFIINFKSFTILKNDQDDYFLNFLKIYYNENIIENYLKNEKNILIDSKNKFNSFEYLKNELNEKLKEDNDEFLLENFENYYSTKFNEVIFKVIEKQNFFKT
jgi:hypothetical protein